MISAIWKRKEVHMAKKPANHGQPWTPTQERQLKNLAAGNTPTRLIAYKLARTEDAIYKKGQDLEVSLKPVNQSPYNRKKK
jgi:hypothetical protein